MANYISYPIRDKTFKTFLGERFNFDFMNNQISVLHCIEKSSIDNTKGYLSNLFKRLFTKYHSLKFTYSNLLELKTKIPEILRFPQHRFEHIELEFESILYKNEICLVIKIISKRKLDNIQIKLKEIAPYPILITENTTKYDSEFIIGYDNHPESMDNLCLSNIPSSSKIENI